MYENLLLNSFISKHSTLMFSIEQWELVRRLKNSGLTKEQLFQAYDDLDRIEADLGQLYNVPTSNASTNNSTAKNDIFNKNVQMILNKNNGIKTQNGSASAANDANVCLASSAAASVVNNYFASIIDPEYENKQVDEFRK